MVLRGAEREHQVEDLLVYGLGTAVGFVDLVYHDDGLLAQREGLLQYEPRLGHGALEGVNQKQHAVAHVEHALYLAAEIGVARGVYNIDFVVLVLHRHILREDRDTAFAFQIVVVEDQVAGVVVGTQQVSRHDHFIHERGLSVVYVCYDSYVAKFLHSN